MKVVKKTPKHIAEKTMAGKLLSYTEFQVLLQEAAQIVNDQPIGLQGLTEDELSPLTVNQLLLGRNLNQTCSYTEEGELCDIIARK